MGNNPNRKCTTCAFPDLRCDRGHLHPSGPACCLPPPNLCWYSWHRPEEAPQNSLAFGACLFHLMSQQGIPETLLSACDVSPRAHQRSQGHLSCSSFGLSMRDSLKPVSNLCLNFRGCSGPRFTAATPFPPPTSTSGADSPSQQRRLLLSVRQGPLRVKVPKASARWCVFSHAYWPFGPRAWKTACPFSAHFLIGFFSAEGVQGVHTLRGPSVRHWTA